MDCMTANERQLYNFIDKNKRKKNFDKKQSQKELIEEIKQFPKDKPRSISKKYLYMEDGTENIKRQIAWWENEIARRCADGFDNVPLLKEVIILKCKSNLMNGIMKQIIDRGIDIEINIDADDEANCNRHYVFYTSSTGQMKNSEITLIESEFWEEHKTALMCGLSEKIIDAKGGINTGKYMSAKALNMSNSEKYDSGITIDDVIIVKDFKTVVHDMVEYLDVNTLDITRTEKDIEIEHMDGAGIFIPDVFPSSCQIRGGWLKGAVFPFDFHKFIKENEKKISKVHMVDAWDNPVSEKVFLKAKMILTDSQLKMHKYYGSMKQYRKCFKKAGLEITVNNWAHYPEKNSEVKVSYQPFQTIPRNNIKDKDIEKLCEKTVRYINDAKTDSKVALKLMGIDLDKQPKAELDPLYASIYRCPQLLEDDYVKKVMENALLSARKKAMGCKLILDGIWSYVCPDLYAFCEWLFLGQDEPEGLIRKGHIYNNYYTDMNNGVDKDVDTDLIIEEVCCIRYPHLSDCEHAVRQVEKSDKCKEWFIGYDTIVSCHDLISKSLQCDWDGDHIEVIHDKAFLDVLDKEKVPLYYEMTKAEPSVISNKNIMTCLLSSFNNENIGYVSNAITKVFNYVDEPDTKLIKVLCAYNNFVIDYFKTQKKMDLGEYAEQYELLKGKDSLCPYFFHYAKDKKKRSCQKYNKNSNTDRICKYIRKQTRDGITQISYSVEDNENEVDKHFNALRLKRNPYQTQNRKDVLYVNLKKLISRLKIENNQRFKNIAKEINKSMDEKVAEDDLFYMYCSAEIKKVIADRVKATEYLVDIEYFQEENIDANKEILWKCFGDVLYANICMNDGKEINNLPVKRTAYQSNSEKNAEIAERIEEIKQEQESLYSVPIYNDIYDVIMDVKTRKNRIYDKYILFILYVLIERAKKNDEDRRYVTIYKNNRQRDKVTKATIDSWISSKCTDGGLEQLKKYGYINIEECDKYLKISFGEKLKKYSDDNFKEIIQDNTENEKKSIFEVKEYNPLIDLFEYNGDRKIKKCEICLKKFIATGNQKTCGNPKCSRLLAKKNK